VLSVSSHISGVLGGKFQLPVLMKKSNELKPLAEFLPALNGRRVVKIIHFLRQFGSLGWNCFSLLSCSLLLIRKY
jgi:hypothetical protein